MDITNSHLVGDLPEEINCEPQDCEYTLIQCDEHYDKFGVRYCEGE